MNGYIQSNGAQSINGPSCSCAFLSNVTQGNLLSVGMNGANMLSTGVSDTQGNVYTLRISQNPGFNELLLVWTCIASATGANTVTISQATAWTNLSMVIGEHDSFSVYDTAASAGGASGSNTVTPVLSGINELLLCFIGSGSTGLPTLSPSTGWTQRERKDSAASGTVVMWTQIRAASGSYAVTGTYPPSQGDIGIVAFTVAPAAEYGQIDSNQIKAAKRHGVDTQIQMSDGSGAIGNLPMFKPGGGITDSGIAVPGGSSGAVGTVTAVSATVPSDFAVTVTNPNTTPAIAITGGVTKSAVQQEAYTYAADTGSANAYAVTLSPAPTLVAGSVVQFKAANANTTASTLNVNGGGAIAIKKNGNSTALSSGDISAGQIITALYDGTVWQIIVAGTGGGAVSSLTTTGTSGPATLVSGVLNIPQYSGGSSPYTAPLLADFTIGNQPTSSTFTDTSTGLVLFGPLTGLVLQALLSNATLGGTFTLVVGMNVSFGAGNTGSGLIVRDAAGKIAQFGVSNASARGVNINYWTNYTTFSSNPVGADSPTVATFIKLVCNGTNFLFYSGNGRNSMTLKSTLSATAFIGTPAKVGLYQYLYQDQIATEFFDWELGP